MPSVNRSLAQCQDQLMTRVRLSWVVLAALTAAVGFVAASDPMLQITSCELGLLPTQGVSTSAQCDESIIDHYGNSIAVVLAFPVLLCLLPAAAPRRAIAWTVAAALTVVSIGAFILMSAFASSSASPPQIVVYGYYLPSALLAVVLAGIHGRSTRAHSPARSDAGGRDLDT
ncbi:MAG: hypothetical protein AAGC80_32070 [Rhodococcus sp. (in: high G+C Gram-positive bacteria)]